MLISLLSFYLYGPWTSTVDNFISLFNGVPELLVHSFILGVHEFVVNVVQWPAFPDVNQPSEAPRVLCSRYTPHAFISSH